MITATTAKNYAVFAEISKTLHKRALVFSIPSSKILRIFTHSQTRLTSNTPYLIKEVEDARSKSDGYDFWNYVYGSKMFSMSELLLSLAQSHNVVTIPYLIKKLDLYTCGKKELVSCSPSYPDIIRKDTVQPLMTYFDTYSTDYHQRVIFSTSPITAPTH